MLKLFRKIREWWRNLPMMEDPMDALDRRIMEDVSPNTIKKYDF